MSKSISRFNNYLSSYQEARDSFMLVAGKLSKARVEMEKAEYAFKSLDMDADEQDRVNALADMAASEIYFEKVSDEFESARENFERFS